jgi:phosphate-selective porin OprO/OprP
MEERMKVMNLSETKTKLVSGRSLVKTLVVTALISSLVVWMGSAAAQENGTDFKVYWKEGIGLDSKDKNFKLKIGGRIQTDWATIDPDSELEDDFPELKGTGVEFRRARLYTSGTVYGSVDFKVQYDFAGGDADFKDVYLGLKGVPSVGHIKVGHMKEPFSLEELTSSKYITFMERALPNAFAPSRNTGFMLHNPALDERMTWAVGYFYNTDDYGDTFEDYSNTNLTARLTGLPWYSEDGEKLLHLGLSYSNQARDEQKTDVRFRQQPEAHITSERLVDTGHVPADGVSLVSPEMALVFGPFSVQGEYARASVDSQVANDPGFSGYYVYASYFLTGKHRSYNTSEAAFDRVKPRNDFHSTNGGGGAWEIALRHSHIDLNDEGISGGKEDNTTVGVNWYLNPNTRVMFNYVSADLEERTGVDDGSVNIFETRFQIDF